MGYNKSLKKYKIMKRPCIRCEIKFKPSSTQSKLCKICIKKSHKERVKKIKPNPIPHYLR